MKKSKLFRAVVGGAMAMNAAWLHAETVKVEIPVTEEELVIDNAGNTQDMWTFGGTVPGPVVRVKEGDTVDFTLVNGEGNEQSHAQQHHPEPYHPLARLLYDRHLACRWGAGYHAESGGTR